MDERKKIIRLLLVDDEESFLLSSARVLERRGFSVDIAPNGVSALEKIEAKEYDAVVLDVKMPDIDGIEVFNHIHRINEALPVILLTGHGSFEDAFETSKAGIADYLSKPIDMDELAEKIHTAVSVAADRSVDEPLAPPAEDLVRVLLVDDEVGLLQSMKKILERRGMQVSTADRGEAALALLEESPVDVVVLDLKMPGMDGQEVLRRIKNRFPTIEVIILTGHPSVESALEVIKLGANEYMKKPPSIEELVGTIRRLYDLRQQTIEKRRHDLIEEIRRRFPD